MDKEKQRFIVQAGILVIDIIFIIIIIVLFNVRMSEENYISQDKNIIDAGNTGAKVIQTKIEDFFQTMESGATVIADAATKRNLPINTMINNGVKCSGLTCPTDSRDFAFTIGPVSSELTDDDHLFDELLIVSKMFNNKWDNVSIINSSGRSYSLDGSSYDASGMYHFTKTYNDGNNNDKRIINIIETEQERKIVLSVPIFRKNNPHTSLGTIAITITDEDFEGLFTSRPYDLKNSFYALMSANKGEFVNNVGGEINTEFNSYVKNGQKSFNKVRAALMTMSNTQIRYNVAQTDYIASVQKLNLGPMTNIYVTTQSGVDFDSWYVFTTVPISGISNLQIKTSSIYLVIALVIIMVLITFGVFIFSMRLAKREYLHIVHDAENSKQDLDNFINRVPMGLLKFTITQTSLNFLFFSQGFLDAVGYQEDQFQNLVDRRLGGTIVVKEDFITLYRSVMESEEEKEKKKCEFRVMSADGTINWVRIDGSATKDGIVYIFLGSIVNITKEHILSSALRTEQIRYRLALQSLDVILFDYDVEIDEINFFSKPENGSDTTKTNYKIENFIESKAYTNIINLKDAKKFIEMISGEGASSLETKASDIFKNDKEQHWVMIRVEHIYEERESKLIRTVGTVTIIDQQKEIEHNLLERAQIDQQTQLYNKMYFQELVTKFIEKDKEGALIIIDIDNFKGINDTQGHLFADTILISLSSELREFVGDLGYVGRVGGDEFAVYLNNYEKKNVLLKTVNNICELYRRTYTNNGKECSVSCSIGIALFPANGSTYAELFKAADTALYNAKNNGKNRLEFYTKDSGKNQIAGYYNNYDDMDKVKDDFLHSILVYAFDLIEHSTDINMALRILFGRMGSMYSLSRITIVDVNHVDMLFVATNQWTDDNTSEVLGNLFKFNEQDEIKYRNMEKDSTIIIDDMNRVSSLEIFQKFSEKLDLKALVACNIYTNNQLSSSVIYESNTDIRIWSYEEIQSIIIFSKLLMSYIIRNNVLREKNQAVEELTNYDSVTGLYTLHKFKIEGQKLLRENPNANFVMFYTDIINFKHYNDKYGYDTGDLILKEIANSSRRAYIPGRALLGRVSADNFVSLVRYELVSELKDYRRKMGNGLAVKSVSGEIIKNVFTKTGVYFINENDDIVTAIDNANIARKSIQQVSMDSSIIFDETIMRKYEKENDVVRNAKLALKNNEFLVYYQTKHNISDGSINGAEALVRWKRKGKIVLPGEFIPILENNGFITEIDFFVYEEVVKLLSTKVDYNRLHGPISVNVSRVHLDDENFIPRIMELLNKYNVPNKCLEFEITESLFFDNQERSVSIINKLRSLGFTISIDDFGTGYSSLNSLEDISADVIKLDRSFLPVKIGSQHKKQIIFKHVIAMANNLRMDVICEGVETLEHVELLRKIGCNNAQGYYFSKPIPEEDFIELVKKQDLIDMDESIDDRK